MSLISDWFFGRKKVEVGSLTIDEPKIAINKDSVYELIKDIYETGGTGLRAGSKFKFHGMHSVGIDSIEVFVLLDSVNMSLTPFLYMLPVDRLREIK